MILDAFKCIFVILSILWVAFQSSCVSPGQMTVASERRIPLFKDTFQEGSWESMDVALEYQYVKKTGVIQLSITGITKSWYEHLAVWVKLVDAEGKVLEKKIIYNSVYRYGNGRGIRIEKTFALPSGTTAIAFQSLLRPAGRLQ